MSAKDPVAESPRAHCHVRLLTAPSMSVTAAVNCSPSNSAPETVTVPGSSTLVTWIVVITVSLREPSETLTVTL